MESLERKQDQTPFKDALIESDVSEFHIGTGKLMELEHDPSKVVRVETFQALQRRYGWPANMERKELVQEIAALVRKGSSLFSELTQKHGIPAPVRFVIGKDPQDRDVVYGVVEKIEGENLDKIEPTPALTEKVEALYEKIAGYYLDKLPKDEPFLGDVEIPEQYVYGHARGETDDNIYLVDTDLFIHDGKYALYNTMRGLVVNVIAVEQKFGKEFTEARRLIKKFITEPLPPQFPEEGKGRVKGIVQDIEQYLDTSQTFLLS